MRQIFINQPDSEYQLDFSQYNSDQYAEDSFIIFVVSNNTRLLLPAKETIKGTPTLNIAASPSTGLIVLPPVTGIYLSMKHGSGVDYKALNILCGIFQFCGTLPVDNVIKELYSIISLA